MKSITVQSLTDMFHLEVLAGANCMDRLITRPQTHRPGLEFVGYFDFFPMERVQVLGRKEINYLLTLSIEERKLHIGNIVKYHPPCFIVTSGQQEIPYLTLFCDQEGIPLLRTAETTTEFIAKLDSYLVKTLAPEMSIHAVCVNVSGIGILLRGKSGIGKSETAHTLIRRGHRFVADDIVVLKKLSPTTLLGTHNVTTREFLALRSIGLINVVRQYGRTAFQDETRIVLDIELSPWQDNSLNNELEAVPQFTEYLGIQIPHIEIQLQPGRDVASLIEAAANNWYLKQLGYSAAEDFMKRVENEMQS
ncbi:HPr kinase/phosphorylase [Paenibacillus glucanolyticus]|jgi:HPr kinase/phosphorylase|uniref:HPr(Ser) kinase/phosphatase n=1 Tax=Paenibacillus TaxID=44249 RepID=UPI0003E23D0F|nr:MULTISPECIES: HPr(Ser) kinase/phosphatase [Paenibacillus]AVV58223.1 HPr kinase/phosphorylase [Paenibacillus glucanolyticus]ETT42981.1 HPr kinase/phosphorylase [Paenibacillus sp. FSL R5-808]MCA4756101.1 HPr kinase/phosphorylase [Mycolicibacterium fortuitum]OMF78680.1 HPr(Ser) kinase/phosphatase [Paenibacillus glucanolyticus]